MPQKSHHFFMFAHSTPLRATHQLWVIFYGANKICNILMMRYSLNMRHLQPYSILHSSKRVNYDFTFSTYSRNVNCTYFMKKICHHPSKGEIPTFLDVSTRHSKFSVYYKTSWVFLTFVKWPFFFLKNFGIWEFPIFWSKLLHHF